MTNSENQAIQDRLTVIEESLQRTRQNIKDESHNYLFWGWLIVGTCALHYVLLTFTTTPLHWLPWPIITGLGGIYTWIYHARNASKKKVTTHIDRFMSWLWATAGVCFFTIAFMCMSYEIIPIPFLLLMSALATFVSGGVLRFKPLILGGALFFIMGLVTLFVPNSWLLPLYAATILLGFIVPGYMLKKA